MPVDRLKDLIAIPSYSGNELRLQEFIGDSLAKGGLVPQAVEGNVVARLRGKDSSRAFIFNSHMDVVDVGDESRWKHNPWQATEVGDRIYGRGACDMKGGMAGTLELAAELARTELPTDVLFTYVVQEETDGLGARQLGNWLKNQRLLDQYKDRAALFTEPTSLREVSYGHRGNYFLRADAQGDSAHSSRPDLIGRHAILEMHDFVGDVIAENATWPKAHPPAEGFVAPSITPTSMEAKSGSVNKTADACTVAFDLRTTPGFHSEAFDRIVELAASRGIDVSKICAESPVGYTDPKSKIVQAALRAIPGSFPKVFEAAADLGFLNEVGIDGIILGPGSMAQAHQINEYVEIDQVRRAPAVFKAVYYSWAADTK